MKTVRISHVWLYRAPGFRDHDHRYKINQIDKEYKIKSKYNINQIDERYKINQRYKNDQTDERYKSIKSTVWNQSDV